MKPDIARIEADGGFEVCRDGRLLLKVFGKVGENRVTIRF